MKIQESAENYLETILMLSLTGQPVRSVDIVKELGFSKPSISVAMKKLRENGYINVDENGYITLIGEGIEIAERIYERHLLLTKVLTELGVNEQTAAADACRMEHVISDETFRVIKEHFADYTPKDTEKNND